MTDSPFSRWKNAAKRLADRVRVREAWQPPPTPPPARGAARFEPARGSPVPRVQPGTGDTPPPTHRTDIGRTWLSAQIVSGVAPFVADLRSAEEFAAGHVPGARNLPGSLAFNAGQLPPQDESLVVCDASGSEDASRVAEKLRDLGWSGARRLVGGFTEWAELGEPVETGPSPSDATSRDNSVEG
jgi:rhodanese-related sulfurtransferase